MIKKLLKIDKLINYKEIINLDSKIFSRKIKNYKIKLPN